MYGETKDNASHSEQLLVWHCLWCAGGWEQLSVQEGGEDSDEEEEEREGMKKDEGEEGEEGEVSCTV